VAHSIAEALRTRVRSGGGAPLVTYYDLDSGERTELSATSFANWVDKTCNLLTDELWVAPGDLVALPLAHAAPGHWVTAVWEIACWQVGAVVDVTGPEVLGTSPKAALRVGGPELVNAELAVESGGAPGSETGFPAAGHIDADGAHPRSRTAAQLTVACSLHPLATGLEGLPADVIDYDLAVRVHPDQYLVVPQPATAPAWVDESRHLTQADLTAAVAERTPRRRLVRPGDPWTTARDGIVTALVSGGSVVTVVGAAEEESLARIRTIERAT
jgi:hypothetical protein